MRCSIRRSDPTPGAPRCGVGAPSFLQKAVFTSGRAGECLAQSRSAANDVRLNQERFAQERDHGVSCHRRPDQARRAGGIAASHLPKGASQETTHTEAIVV